VIRKNGNVGIGTANPMTGNNNAGLQLSKGGHSTFILGNPFQDGKGGIIQTSDDRHRLFLGANFYDDINSSWTSITPSKGAAGISIVADQGGWGTQVSFYVSEDGSLKERMAILGNGNVGIGTACPQAKLAVNGDIFSTKVKVTLTGWCDYVFNPTYRLRPLSEVEQYIQQHHHLPEVPSAAEVEKNGLDLGDNQATLLKKIEELTLYLIEQNKNQQYQEKLIKEQRALLEVQQKRLDELEKQLAHK